MLAQLPIALECRARALVLIAEKDLSKNPHSPIAADAFRTYFKHAIRIVLDHKCSRTGLPQDEERRAERVLLSLPALQRAFHAVRHTPSHPFVVSHAPAMYSSPFFSYVPLVVA